MCPVHSLRQWTGASVDALSAVCLRTDDGSLHQRVIGPLARIDRAGALSALEAARAAWDLRRGAWPTMRVAARVEALSAFAAGMRAVREESVRLLM